MNAKKLILPGVVIVVIILSLTVFLFMVSKKAKSFQNETAALKIEKADLQKEVADLRNAAEDSDGLSTKLESYQDSLAESQALAARLAHEKDSIALGWDDCRGSKVVTKATARQKAAVKTAKPATVAPPAVKKAAPAVPAIVSVISQAVPVKTIVADDDLAYLKEADGKILCCFRVNGSKDGHFPHYAIDRGAKMSEAVDNGYKGYNLALTPISSMAGSYGVTTDGTFYVSARYLESYLNTSGQALKYVDLLYKGNWGGVRMTLNGNYYVYATK